MTKKEHFLPRERSLFSRREGSQPSPDGSFSGRYAVTFEGNPFAYVLNNQIFDGSIPVKGTGHADILGMSTLYMGLMVNTAKDSLQGHLNLLFQASDGTQMYADGDMSYTPVDANGQVALAGVMVVKGGTGRYRRSQGTLALTGTLNGAKGTGTLTFNGSVSMQT